MTDFGPVKLSARLVIIDPKPLTRRALAQMLATASSDNVTIAVANADELPEPHDAAAKNFLPLVLLYVRSACVADRWVQQELQRIWARFPTAPVALLSDRDEADEVSQSISCGVRGYIPTSVDCNLAFAALRLIDVGGTYIPAHLVTGVSTRPNGIVEAQLNLTAREFAVARLLQNSNKMIARTLEIGEATVKVHVRNVIRKLHATNRTQAAVLVERGLALPAGSFTEEEDEEEKKGQV
jgi:DNA-binding NarL/FixJ family response regulator